jgi:hypothetical protein
MSLSQSDPGDSPVDNVAPAFGILDAVGADRPPITDRPPPVIDRPASAVDRLVSGAMDRPRSSNLDRRSSGSYKFLPLLSERSSGIPAAVFSGGRYYTPSGLPSYRSTETISEGGTPPRVGTPSTG